MSESIPSTLIDDLAERFKVPSLSQVGKLMQDSLNQLKTSGLPGKHLEHFKYTNVSKELPETFKAPEFDDAHSTLKIPMAHKIVLVNGHVTHCDEIPGVAVHIEDPLQERSGVQLSIQERDGLGLLHWSSLQRVLQITIDSKIRLEHPIFIQHIFTKKANHRLSSVRIVINALKHSDALVVEQIEGHDNHQTWSLLGTEINIESAARLTHVQMASDFKSGLIYQNLKAHLGRDSYFNSFGMNLNGQLARRDVQVNLNEENATAHVNGLFAVKNHEHADIDCIINHNAPHTFSDQLYKGLASDKGHGIFTGKIVVHRDAQKVDSAQLSKNLLLSKLAHIDARPQLEVYADDVKCAHGATIGQLSEDELFYLVSRGIHQKDAAKILANAFVQEAMNKIGQDEIIRLSSEYLKSRFNIEEEGEKS